MERRGEALTTRGSSRQGGHHQGAQRQALPQGLHHGMLWHLAAEDGREGDMVHPQGQVFQIFDFLSTHTIDQKDPYLGTGNFTATIPLPNSLSLDLEGGFKFFEKKIREKKTQFCIITS